MEEEDGGRERLRLQLLQLHRVLQETYSQLDRLDEEQQENYNPLEPPAVWQQPGGESSSGSYETIAIMAQHTLRAALRLSRCVSLMRLSLLRRDIEVESVVIAQRLADLLEGASHGGASSSGEQKKTDEGLSTEMPNQLAHSSTSSSASSLGSPAAENTVKNEDESLEESRKNISTSAIRVTDAASTATCLNVAGTSSDIQRINNNQIGSTSLGDDKMLISTTTNSVSDGDRMDGSHSPTTPSLMVVPLTGYLASEGTIKTQMVTPTHSIRSQVVKTSVDEVVSGASGPRAGADSSPCNSSDPQIIDSESTDTDVDAGGISKRVMIKTLIFPEDNPLNCHNPSSTSNWQGCSLISEGNTIRAHSPTQVGLHKISPMGDIHSETNEISGITYVASGSCNREDSSFSTGTVSDSFHDVEITVLPSDSSPKSLNGEGSISMEDSSPCAHHSPDTQDKTGESLSAEIRPKTPTEYFSGHDLLEAGSIKEEGHSTDDSSGCQDKAEGSLSVDNRSQLSTESEAGVLFKADVSSERERDSYNYQSLNIVTETDDHLLSVKTEVVGNEEGTMEYQIFSPRQSTDRLSQNKYSPSTETHLKADSFSINSKVTTKNDVSSTILLGSQRNLEWSPSFRTSSELIPFSASSETMEEESPPPTIKSESTQELEESPKFGTLAETSYFSASPQSVSKLDSPSTSKPSDCQPAVEGSPSDGDHLGVFHFTTSQIKKERQSPTATTLSDSQQKIEDSQQQVTRLKTVRFSISPTNLKRKNPSSGALSGSQKIVDDSPSAGTRSKAFRLLMSPQVTVKQESPSTSLTCQNEEGSTSKSRSKAIRLSRNRRVTEGRKHKGEATPQGSSSRFQSILVSSSVLTRSRSFLKSRESLSVGTTALSSSSLGCQDDAKICPSVVTFSKAERLSVRHYQTEFVSQTHEVIPSKLGLSSYRRKIVSLSYSTQSKVVKLSTGKRKEDSSSRECRLPSEKNSSGFQRKRNGSQLTCIGHTGRSISVSAQIERNSKAKVPKITSAGNENRMNSFPCSVGTKATKTYGEALVKRSSRSKPDKMSAINTYHRDNEIDSPAAHTRYKPWNVSLIAQNTEKKTAPATGAQVIGSKSAGKRLREISISDKLANTRNKGYISTEEGGSRPKGRSADNNHKPEFMFSAYPQTECCRSFRSLFKDDGAKVHHVGSGDCLSKVRATTGGSLTASRPKNRRSSGCLRSKVHGPDKCVSCSSLECSQRSISNEDDSSSRCTRSKRSRL